MLKLGTEFFHVPWTGYITDIFHLTWVKINLLAISKISVKKVGKIMPNEI
jgi:hypothetical protein